MASRITPRGGAVVRLVGILLGLTMGVILTAALLPPIDASSPHSSGHDKISPERPECPRQWDSIPVFPDSHQVNQPTEWIVVAPGGLEGPGPITDIPEFHDCQRLISDPDNTFKQLMAVFAFSRLDSRLRVLAQKRPRATALAVAKVYNYGDWYHALGIAPNFNCLYLTAGVSGTDWQARMVPIGKKDGACKPLAPDATIGKALTVVRTQVEGAKFRDYPPVARWDRDVSGQYYIVIKCGDGLCQIGDASFAPTPGLFEANPALPRVLRIKTWYDQQQLAIPDAEGKLVPSGIRGTVIPHGALDLYRVVDFNKWARAGYVALDSVGPGFSESIKYYVEKFNMHAVDVTQELHKMNELLICRGTRGECNVPDTGRTSVELCGPDRKLGLPVKRWWMQIKSPGDVSAYRCIIQRGHPNLPEHIPGTARWRWSVEDETVWERCTQGCCEVTAKK